MTGSFLTTSLQAEIGKLGLGQVHWETVACQVVVMPFPPKSIRIDGCADGILE